MPGAWRGNSAAQYEIAKGDEHGSEYRGHSMLKQRRPEEIKEHSLCFKGKLLKSPGNLHISRVHSITLSSKKLNQLWASIVA